MPMTKYDTCRPCHSLINPLGDALENFDAIGKWQTVDQLSGPIDAAVTVDINGSSKQIGSPAQLMQENCPRASSPAAVRAELGLFRFRPQRGPERRLYRR